MVEPFIKYVLLHPSPSSEVSHIGHSLSGDLKEIKLTLVEAEKIANEHFWKVLQSLSV